MGLNHKAIVKIFSIACRIIGLSMIPSLIVAFIYGESKAAISFIASIGIAVLISLPLSYISRKADLRLFMRDGFLIVTMTWIISGLIGALPFIVSGSITDPFKAFFEACSGFSTTGSSIIDNVEILPKSILFWRSFTHWIGGMGIVVFAIALLPSLGLNGQTIAGVETPGPTLDKISPKMSDTAKSLYLTYSIFTVVQIVLLYLGGMNLFDSCVHSFGSMGTGGFSDYNLSIGHFHNAYIDTIIIIFMLLSGASFNLHFKAIKYGPKVYTKDIELRTYLFIFLIASLIIMIDLKVSGTYSSLTEAADKVSFQVTSILTTTGYNNANYDLWPSLSKIVLFLLMFIGGCSCSTGGGVKVIRIIILIQYIRRGIALRLHPNAVVEVKINGRKVQSETIGAIMTHVFLFSIVAAAGTLLVSFDNLDIVTSFTSVLSAIGNIGPAFCRAGPMSNYSVFSDFSLTVLSFLMVAGRLELVTFFVLFTPRFWDPHH